MALEDLRSAEEYRTCGWRLQGKQVGDSLRTGIQARGYDVCVAAAGIQFWGELRGSKLVHLMCSPSGILVGTQAKVIWQVQCAQQWPEHMVVPLIRMA